jgi:uncharacterized protein (TIGR02996 family)
VSVVSDEEALMAAIDAAPFDDAPRLVYADWLQERGDEAKAEYLRTVVRLMHPPEDRGDVDRCISLSAGLDLKWRQQVGARFEVMIEGQFLRVLAYAFRVILKFPGTHPLDCSRLERPITLKSAVTREEADRLFDTYQQLNARVQVMNEDSRPGLFAS